jgi:hypothetical protein
LTEALAVVSLLERFGGYTMTSLMEEDANLIRMVRMVDREREVNADGE